MRSASGLSQPFLVFKPTSSEAKSLLLVGCIEDWARRNQPGLMLTAGTTAASVSCVYLRTRRLSPAVAEEAREAAGLEPPEGHAGRIVAAGCEAVVSVGGIHSAVCGGEILKENL